MTHRRDRMLSARGLARVEGEGGLYVRVHDDRVDEVRLDIYEPPRFFEAFLRGRGYTEPPEIDPETLTVTVSPGLSAPAEGRLPRTWIALLVGRVRASLAASTGVETAGPGRRQPRLRSLVTRNKPVPYG